MLCKSYLVKVVNKMASALVQSQLKKIKPSAKNVIEKYKEAFEHALKELKTSKDIVEGAETFLGASEIGCMYLCTGVQLRGGRGREKVRREKRNWMTSEKFSPCFRLSLVFHVCTCTYTQPSQIFFFALQFLMNTLALCRPSLS